METVAANRSEDGTTAAQAAFLAGWLLPQLAVLALCACRIGLWAKAPPASELIALPMMLAVQTATAALVYPRLHRRSYFIMTVATAWPMASIAATLGAAPIRIAVQGEIAVAFWILTVALASSAAKRWWGSGVVWAIAILWSVGGGLLFYLRLEFSPTLPPLAPFLVGPLVYVVRIGIQDANFSFIPLLSSTVISLLFFGIARARAPRAREN